MTVAVTLAFADLMTTLATVLSGVLLIDLGLMFYEFVVPLLAFQPHDGDVIRVIALGSMWWSFCSRRPYWAQWTFGADPGRRPAGGTVGLGLFTWPLAEW